MGTSPGGSFTFAPLIQLQVTDEIYFFIDQRPKWQEIDLITVILIWRLLFWNSPAMLLCKALQHLFSPVTRRTHCEINNKPSLTSAGDRETGVTKRSRERVAIETHHSWKQSVKRWMNVGVELSVEVTGLQNAFRPRSLFCRIHMNFLCDIICIFYPLFIPSFLRMQGACMSVSCIYWLTFCGVSVCLHLCPISLWLSVSFQRCRLLLSSCFSAAIETPVAQPLQPRYHISCSRFPRWLRNGPLSSSHIISSPCRLRAVVQQLDSQADESQQTPDGVIISSSVRSRGISCDLTHVWIQLFISSPTRCYRRVHCGVTCNSDASVLDREHAACDVLHSLLRTDCVYLLSLC